MELADVGGTYYVRNGNHFISVVFILGQVYVEAEIIMVGLNCRIM
jgi:hypothetical protein